MKIWNKALSVVFPLSLFILLIDRDDFILCDVLLQVLKKMKVDRQEDPILHIPLEEDILGMFSDEATANRFVSEDTSNDSDLEATANRSSFEDTSSNSACESAFKDFQRCFVEDKADNTGNEDDADNTLNEGKVANKLNENEADKSVNKDVADNCLKDGKVANTSNEKEICNKVDEDESFDTTMNHNSRGDILNEGMVASMLNESGRLQDTLNEGDKEAGYILNNLKEGEVVNMLNKRNKTSS
jgi:hypothetical protein